jgi:hypothetical protein
MPLRIFIEISFDYFSLPYFALVIKLCRPCLPSVAVGATEVCRARPEVTKP